MRVDFFVAILINYITNIYCVILYIFFYKTQNILLIYSFKGYIIHLYLQFRKSWSAFVMEEITARVL